MNTKKINIIIIDDHQMMIDGLVAILSTNLDLNILKTYTNGNDFLIVIDNLQPDFVLFDIIMLQIYG